MKCNGIRGFSGTPQNPSIPLRFIAATGGQQPIMPVLNLSKHSGGTDLREYTTLAASGFDQRFEELDRQREDDGVALVAGDGVEGLQVAQLHRLRRLRQHLRGL